MMVQVTVDVQRSILSKMYFHTKFKTTTLKKISLKKLFEKLKTRTSNPQKSQRSARRW